AEMRGEEVPVEIQSSINLGLDIRIPADYISDDHQRLRAYKRIADTHSEEQARKVLDELADRYGPVPEAVRLLVDFALLKSSAQKLGVEAIDKRQGFLNVKFHPGSKVDPNRLMELVQGAQGAQFTPAGVLRLPVPVRPVAASLIEYLKEKVAALTPEPAPA